MQNNDADIQYYDVCMPWVLVAWFSAEGFGAVLVSLTYPSQHIINAILIGACFIALYIIAINMYLIKIFKPKVSVTNDSVTIPSAFLVWKKTTIVFDHIQGIHAGSAWPGFRSLGTSAQFIIKYNDKKYRISQLQIGYRAFHTCINTLLERILLKRPDLSYAYGIIFNIPMLGRPLLPPHKTNRLLIGIVLIPVFLIILIVALGTLLKAFGW